MEVDSLLNLDSDGDQAPVKKENDGDSNQNTAQSNEQINALVEQNKKLQEQMRQITEANQPLKEFYDRVMANTTDEKQKKEAHELMLRYEEDPIAVTQELIKQNIVPVQEAIMQNVSTLSVEKAMAKIDKKYTVDWAKDSSRIVKELAKFSEEAKKNDPSGTLEAACRLAGVITDKTKEEKTPPVVETSVRTGSRPAPTEHSDHVNSRLNTIGNKKKENVFGI